MEPEIFAAQVADAFAHLYDLVYLRTHPLAELGTPAPDLPHKKKAWLLHDLLLGVIEELDPGYHAPADGREKRRYRLLSMRYSEGLASKAVADSLAISLRHYYREHDTAIEAVAAILWERYGRNHPTYQRSATERSTAAISSQPEIAVRPPSTLLAPADESPNRQALLRAEAAHFQDSGKKMRLGEVLSGVIALAGEMARAKGLRLTLESPQDLSQHLTPHLSPPLMHNPLVPDPRAYNAMVLPMDGTMVRQILLGLLSYLGEQLAEGEIVVRVHSQEHEQIVEIVGVGRKSAATTLHEGEEQLATLYELAALQSAQLRPLPASAEPESGSLGQEGFTLHLPREARHTVLLVDDNSDILELYQRYLQQREYRAVAVQSGGEALRLASQLQPQAIVLDLMLPEQDGWEILQRLTNHPATHSIPVVICSILRARQLALALGAAAFLDKPVDETTLLGVLDTLIAADVAKG